MEVCPTVELNGCHVHVERSPRDGACRRVLLLHGWGCDSTIFSFISSGLAEQADVTVLDFPGHGKSDEPPEPWGVPEYAAMVKALIEREKLAPVEIVAHSFGARVALYLASEWPELVDKLVITGGAGVKKPASIAQQKRQRRFKRYNALLSKLADVKPFAKPAAKMQQALRMRYGSPDYNRLSDSMRRTFVKVISLDLVDRLPLVKAPTLLIWGSADTETPLWMGQVMEREIPDAGMVIFEGGSHFAFLEQWQRFLIIVKRFVLEDS